MGGRSLASFIELSADLLVPSLRLLLIPRTIKCILLAETESAMLPSDFIPPLGSCLRVILLSDAHAIEM